MDTTTNRDVWGHVVKYFRVSLSGDSAEDVKIKRNTLVSIALTCSELTAVAAIELWRSVTTLEPVVHAFEPAPFSNASPAFKFKHDKSSDYWEIEPDHLTKAVKSRVLGYLHHIHYLYFPALPSSKERALWQALLAFNWISPLCPNLRGITFAAGNISASMAYYYVPFLVQSVQSIRFSSATATGDEAAASIFLKLAKHRNVQVSDIVYTGFTSRRLLKQIFGFPTLRSARMLSTAGHHNHLEASHMKFFRPSVLLTSLDIDLGMFHCIPEIGSWIESLQTLSSLSLHGTPPAVIDCMQKRTFLLVHSLTLLLLQPDQTPTDEPTIISMISMAFPILHSLHFENKQNNNTTTAGIKFPDIFVLREKPLRCLVIRGLQFSLSCSNIIDIVTTWPSLERLSLVPDPKKSFTRYSANELLLYISFHAPRLTDMNLPLDMASLVTTQPLVAKPTVCPLQRLELAQVQNLPKGLKGKLILAQNLLVLFPRLNVVSSNIDIQDFQMIVKSFSGILSSPPQRNDNLF